MLSDKEINALIMSGQQIITPYFGHQKRVNGCISFGQSSAGYDVRVGRDFKIFSNWSNTTVDPKDFNNALFTDVHADNHVDIPPNSFALSVTLERICMPRDIMGLCVGKSTYARCGVIVNVTPIEPGWEGYITIEISNTNPLPARIHCGEGIAQLLFFKLRDGCEVSYADRKGKYQNQKGITLPR